MKRILFINSHREISGGEVVLINLLKTLDRSRYAPIVVSPGTGPFQSAIEDLDVQVRVIRMSVSPGRGSKLLIFKNMARFSVSCISTVRSLVNVIKQEKIDIVHAGTFQSLLYALPAARFTKVPVVWHCHEYYLYRGIGPLFMNRATHIIATSHALRRNLIDSGIPSDKVTTAHCSVDPRIFAGLPTMDPGTIIPSWKNGRPIVTTIGRLVPFKGQDIFIEAAYRVLKSFPDTYFLIVGGPLFTDQAFMEKIKTLTNTLGIENRVIFTGHRDDVPALIKMSDIIVLPSRAEPFGISALEGMMAGKPVIVTDTSGAAEIISSRETGLIVPAFSAPQLADSIMELLTNPQLTAKIAQNAWKYANENMTPVHMSQKIEFILDSEL